jgi:hypothetical protein
MAIIRHFTHICHLDSIIHDNTIELEGHNFLNNPDLQKYYPEQQRLAMLRSYEIVGRLVWFTESDQYLTKNVPLSQMIPLEFDSEEIGAIKWDTLKRKLSYHKLRTAYLNNLMATASDNVAEWWATTKPVSLDYLKNKNILNSPLVEIAKRNWASPMSNDNSTINKKAS